MAFLLFLSELFFFVVPLSGLQGGAEAESRAEAETATAAKRRGGPGANCQSVDAGAHAAQRQHFPFFFFGDTCLCPAYSPPGAICGPLSVFGAAHLGVAESLT